MSVIKLIGDAPNQVSRNKDLGDLAYQNAANIAGNVTAGSINNTPIGSTTASTGAFTTLTSTSDAAINGVKVGRGGGSVSTNTAVGTNTMNATATGTANTAVGTTALRDVTSGISNTALGASALIQNTTGDYNTALGSNAMFANTSGGSSVAIGFQSLYFNTTGTFNNAFGRSALNANTTGANNIGIGSSALQAITTTSNNTAVGHSAGSTITTGAKNTLLGCYNGNQGGLDIRTASNNIVLSDGDGNPRLLVNSVGNVGIGTTTPQAKLDVNGNARFGSFDINSSGSKTLWIAGSDFSFGTFYSNALLFLTSDVERMRINSTGNVGIGTTLPAAKLHVSGSFRVGTASDYAQVNQINTNMWAWLCGPAGVYSMYMNTGNATIGIGAEPNASAILDVQSTTKGVRMPNMTTTQKNAIASPAAGLMVFDTTLSKLAVYTGAAWQTITSA